MLITFLVAFNECNLAFVSIYRVNHTKRPMIISLDKLNHVAAYYIIFDIQFLINISANGHPRKKF